MIHLVNVSVGAASAVCLFRVIERFGIGETRVFFADTNWEHPDCYRFIDGVERVAGVKVQRLSDGRNIWDIFFEKYMMTQPGTGGCLASWELKRIPLERHAEQFGGDVTIYVGFGPDEEDRMTRLELAKPETNFEFPLTWRPAMFRCDCLDDLRSRGIRPPSMYDDNYPHANCGGACILAGIKQWAGLLLDNRELYLVCEENEQRFLAILVARGREPHTILRDRRGGKSVNYSLRQLREDIESGRRQPDDSWRAMSCSCLLF